MNRVFKKKKLCEEYIKQIILVQGQNLVGPYDYVLTKII